MFDIDGGTAKFDYKTGGHAEWVGRVESVKLATLTPDKVQAWKVAFLKDAAANPIQLAKARRSVNSFIRCAKSLFSSKATKFLANVTLPAPLPFAGVAFEKSGSMRYKSSLDYRALVVAARNELAATRPEQYKIFLLAIGAGLRKAEIDTLTWRQIDWQAATIWIGATEHFTPKTEDSQGTVDVDPELLDELRRHMAASQSEFVINSPLPARPDAAHQYYRCATEFDALNRWLHSKGIVAQKPLHELRKEFGSLVCQQAGIFAASTQLRHGDIRVTASFYLDKKQRVTVKLGGLLKGPAIQALPEAKAVNE
ncbi:MAG: tyrosine-type recombinase/integrase [Verrucomicrobia bacterium]|nr:tyrosine-type recombinase/integrase [Verrucomicrobiota bacterium]